MRRVASRPSISGIWISISTASKSSSSAGAAQHHAHAVESALGQLHVRALGAQQFAGDLPVQRVVFHHEQVQAFEARCPFAP